MKTLYRLLAILVILGIGLVIALTLMRTKPEVERRPMTIAPPLVEYVEVFPGRQDILIEVAGTPVPEREVLIQAQVAGQVVWKNPRIAPGAKVDKGDVLVRIDPRDYELTLEEQRVALTRARVELETELALAEVARLEWALLKGDMEYSEEGQRLALRKPQVENARASLAAAESALEKAKLHLERTVIGTPFPSVIMADEVELGGFLSAGAPLVRLAGSEAFRVQALVSLEDLSRIAIPGVNADKGSPVTVIQQAGPDSRSYRGIVEGLDSRVDPQGLMAQLLIRVPDPLGGEDDLPLLLGAYVNVRIEGRAEDDVYTVPASALREDRRVWIIDDDQRLRFRDVQRVWRTTNDALVRGLEPGDRVVVTRIAAPVDGMLLHLAETGEASVEHE